MKNLDEALKILVDNVHAPHFTNHPFYFKDCLYATDSKIIARIRMPLNRVYHLYKIIPGDQVNNLLRLFKTSANDFKTINPLIINTSELETALNKIPLIDDYLNAKHDGTCAECDGDKSVEWEYNNYTEYFDCPVCNGEGTISISTRVKTGTQSPDPAYYIDILQLRFAYGVIEKLVKFLKALKYDKIEFQYISYDNNILILYTGSITIGIMPVIKNDAKNKIAHSIQQETI